MSKQSLTRTNWEIRPVGGGPPIRGDVRVESGSRPETAVVICHGFKGFRSWGFFPPLARAVARDGHAAVTFDFSHNGVGANGVDFSALDLFARNTHSREVREIRSVLDALRNGLLGTSVPQRVGLFGHSRGGATAVLAAAADTQVSALVTWAAVSSLQRWTEEQVRTWKSGEPVHISNARTGQEMPMGPGYWRDLEENAHELDVLAAARRLERPWLLLHGTADESVPVEEGRALHRAGGDPHAKKLELHGAGHTFGAAHPFAGASADLRRATHATLSWFRAHLDIAQSESSQAGTGFPPL